MNTVLPTVSIVVPVFNRKVYVSQLLASIESLTYPRDRFEVIMVDNGSTDGTWEMLVDAAKTLPFRFQCFKNPSEIKLPAASRNFGVSKASGDIIAFTDSDCMVSPGWLDAGALLFSETVGIVQGLTVLDATDPRPVLHHKVVPSAQGTYAETCNIFYKKELIQRVGGFDETMRTLNDSGWGNDTDLAYRVKALGYKLVFCNEAKVIHHVVPINFRSWLLQPIRAASWSKVVKMHPEIRHDLMVCRYFVTKMTALFDLMLVGLLLGVVIKWFFALLAIPFLILKYREGGHHLSPVLRVVRLGGGSLRAFVLFCTLLYSSVRFRALVL